VRRGIVRIENGGKPLAVGTVLQNDGRVLSALSALTNIAEPELRYDDGTVVKATVVHKDPAWDLALLAPLSGKWLDGLVPTDAAPQGLPLRAFVVNGGGSTPVSVPVAVKGRSDVASKDGAALRAALEIDLLGNASAPGTPLLDASGRVVGVLVRACKEVLAGSCKTALTVGAPVYALRAFLLRTPTAAVRPAPWLGIGGASSTSGSTKGVKIVGVAPASPAEKAGLHAGDDADLIAAVDGQPIETPEQLAEVIAQRAIGQSVKLLVVTSGKFREVVVTLRATP
jgi:S1-C subfamily serine protease